MQIVAAAVVTARPWKAGTPLDAQRGIVFVPEHSDAVALVWFPNLGDPRPGTVQAIFYGEISDVRTLEGEAPSWVVKSYRACKRANRAGGWLTEWRPAGFEIERVARMQ